jgi:predicted CopG family antitoxin
MATKSLTITEDAYERLKDHKRPDESFSDVVNRLTHAESDPMKAAGKYPGLGDQHAEFREKFDRDTKERQRELFGQ